MARDKKGKGRASTPKIESPIFSDSEETREDTPPRAHAKRKAGLLLNLSDLFSSCLPICL